MRNDTRTGSGSPLISASPTDGQAQQLAIALQKEEIQPSQEEVKAKIVEREQLKRQQDAEQRRLQEQQDVEIQSKQQETNSQTAERERLSEGNSPRDALPLNRPSEGPSANASAGLAPFAATQEPWQTATGASPVGVIRTYYEALQRRDAPSVLTAWSQPPARLQEKLQRVEAVKIHDLQLAPAEAGLSSVAVDVTTTDVGQKPKRWGGIITLEPVNGTWKIRTMSLK